MDFRIAQHSISGANIVEILVDGNVVGVIYPTPDPKQLKIVSAHFESVETDTAFAGEVEADDGARGFTPIPATLITFEPSPWIISGNKVIKINTKHSDLH
jgi:hypothetical protein